MRSDDGEDEEPEPELSARTLGARNVTESGAILEGELVEIDNTDEARVGFQYNNLGTYVEPMNEPGVYIAEIAGLEPDTEYEYFAFARRGDHRVVGETKTFTTLV